jgi:hypothetical protein
VSRSDPTIIACCGALDSLSDNCQNESYTDEGTAHLVLAVPKDAPAPAIDKILAYMYSVQAPREA